MLQTPQKQAFVSASQSLLATSQFLYTSLDNKDLSEEKTTGVMVQFFPRTSREADR